MSAGDSTSLSRADLERRAYLTGRYDQLRQLSTSPRMNRPQLALIKDLAQGLKPELSALGVEFKDGDPT